MKFKVTNISERSVYENLPDVVRFSLHPGDSIFVDSRETVELIKQARGIGSNDLEFTPILEDAEVVKILKKVGV